MDSARRRAARRGGRPGRGRPRAGRAGGRPGPPVGLDAADRRHRAEPRRPRRPHAPGVRVRPPDRSPARRARPPAARAAARAAPRRRRVDAAPLRRGHPPRLGCSGSWSSTARWSSWCASRLPADGLGLDVRVADARAGLADVPADSCDVVLLDVYAGARIPAHLTSVEFVRGRRPGAAPGRVLRREPRRRRGRAHAGTRGGRRWTSPVGRRRPPRRCSPRSRSSRRRTCCTAAGSATSCSSPAAGTGRTCRWPRWPGGWRRTRSRPGSSRARPSPRGRRSVTDATAVPSPRPPRGLFGQ